MITNKPSNLHNSNKLTVYTSLLYHAIAQLNTVCLYYNSITTSSYYWNVLIALESP